MEPPTSQEIPWLRIIVVAVVGIQITYWWRWRDRPRLRVDLRSGGLPLPGEQPSELIFNATNAGGRVTSIDPSITMRARIPQLSSVWRFRKSRPFEVEYALTETDTSLNPHQTREFHAVPCGTIDHSLLFFRTYRFRTSGGRGGVVVRVFHGDWSRYSCWRFYGWRLRLK